MEAAWSSETWITRAQYYTASQFRVFHPVKTSNFAILLMIRGETSMSALKVQTYLTSAQSRRSLSINTNPISTFSPKSADANIAISLPIPHVVRTQTLVRMKEKYKYTENQINQNVSATTKLQCMRSPLQHSTDFIYTFLSCLDTLLDIIF